MQIALCLFNNGLKEYTRENCGDIQLYSFKIPDYLKDFYSRRLYSSSVDQE